MPRIGSVPYLNARPLLAGLETISEGEIYLASPAGLHEAMDAGQLDVALLPIVSYLENPQLKLIPGSGIACRGPVQSVRVFHQHRGINLANTQKIFLDTESKTSQRLLKVLLVKKYDRKLEDIEWVDQIQAAESVLQIGDKVLNEKRWEHATDLGQEWFELTGLSFVFACWMSRVPVSADLPTQLHNAKMQGLNHLTQIAQDQNVMDPDEALLYLSQNIQYDVQGPELVGMKLFFDWVVDLENQDYDTSLRFVA